MSGGSRGLQLSLAAISLMLAPMFLLPFLAIRGQPVYFDRKDLAAKERLPFCPFPRDGHCRSLRL